MQVGNECYYAGSAKYVIFGTMCKLCWDEFGKFEFSQDAMRLLVGLYKLWGLKGDNVDTAKAWATAGCQGWPSGGYATAGRHVKLFPYLPNALSGPGFQNSLVSSRKPLQRMPFDSGSA